MYEIYIPQQKSQAITILMYFLRQEASRQQTVRFVCVCYDALKCEEHNLFSYER